MAIRQRGTSWTVDVRHGDQRVRKDYSSEAEALRAEAEIKIALKAGTYGESFIATTQRDLLTLAELKARVWSLVWSKQKAARGTGSVADLVVAYFGKDRDVSSIGYREINDFKLTLAKAGNSPATINRKLAALSKMLRFAQAEGTLKSAPRIGREKEGKGRDRFMTKDEEAKMVALLKVWGEHDAADFTIFLLDTGARLGEGLALKWSEISAGPKRVTFFDTKNGDPRTIPLTARLREMLFQRAHRSMPSTSAEMEQLSVWPGFDGGRRYRRLFEKAARHMGLADDPHMVIHILRHTCASRLLQAGANLEYVARWLGHRSLKVTQRYAHLAPTSLDALAAMLDNQPEEKPRHLGVVEGGKA